MKTPPLICSALLLLFAFSPTAGAAVEDTHPFAVEFAPDPVLERYVLGLGLESGGTVGAVNDRRFGNGTARASVTFLNPAREYAGTLVLDVSRRVRRDEITFALLCSSVRVEGFNAENQRVYAMDLPGFTFGDSQSGRYTKVLRNLPLSAARYEVTFFGNYE